MDEVGCLTKGELTRTAIIQLYKQYFGTTQVPGSSKDIDRALQPETAKNKVSIAQNDICGLLGGKITGEGDHKVCEFVKYEMVNPKTVEQFSTSVPIRLLTRELVKTQYTPSKEAVQDALKASKK